MSNILTYLEYGFPTIAAIFLVVVFLIDRTGHPKAASASLLLALICILVPEIVRFYKKVDNTTEKLANENYIMVQNNGKEIVDLKAQNKILNNRLDSLSEQINKIVIKTDDTKK